MKLKLALALLALTYFATIGQTKVIEPIPILEDFPEDIPDDEYLKLKITKNGLLESMVSFVKEFKSIMSHIKDVKQLFQKDMEKTAEILELFNQYNTSAVCNSCQKFVGFFRKHEKPDILKKAMRKAGKLLCREFVHPEVCDGVVESFGDVLFETLYNKIFDPYHICEGFFMCPKVSQKAKVKDYVADVLKDKPMREVPTPTKKSTYTIMHFSDPHIDYQYQPGTNAFCDQPLCCRESNGIPSDPSNAAQYWGTVAGCDLPQRTFQQFLQFVADNFDIDMIIWTGDNVSHDIWQQNEEDQTQNTYDTTQDLIKYFPDTHIYPMFGNHEAFPADEFDFSGHASDGLMQRLSEMWKGWLDEEAFKTFSQNSYYSMVNPEHNVKVIALNTIACDNMDFYLIKDPTDPNHQLEWLRNELYDAENKNQGVFILGHIPPGSFNCISAWSARYRALVDRFTHVIRAQFFGHSHKDEFEVVRSYKDNSPVGTVYIAPSFTTFTGHQPSFRIFEIDSETNVPVNYYQYRLDLDKWNKDTVGPIQWDLAYDFLSQYGAEDMSFKSFDKLSERIKKEDKVAKIYAANYHGNGKTPAKISKKQLQHYYCETRNSVSMDAFECLGLRASAMDLMNIAEQMLPGAWHFSEC